MLSVMSMGGGSGAEGCAHLPPQEMPPSPPKHQPSPLPARSSPLYVPSPQLCGSPMQPQLLRQHSAPAALAPGFAVQPALDEWYSCMITRDAESRTFGVNMKGDDDFGEVQVVNVPGESARRAGVRDGSIVHSIASQVLGDGGINRLQEILADPSVQCLDTVAFVFRHPSTEAAEFVMSTPLAADPVPAAAVVSAAKTLPKKQKGRRNYGGIHRRWEGKTESWGAKEIIAFFNILESHGRNFQRVAHDLTAQNIPKSERQARNFYSRLARSLREWYEKNGRHEVIVEEPAESLPMCQAQKDKQLRQLLCFWEMMKESPEQLTIDNTPFPRYAVEGIKEHLYAQQVQSRLPIPERLVVLLTPMDSNARDAVLSKLNRDTACLKLSAVRAKKPISSIIRHCMNKWPLEREFGVESLSLFPRHGTPSTVGRLHWSLKSADRVVDVARVAGNFEPGTVELTYGWNAPAPSAPPPARATDSGAASSSNNGCSPPVTEPAMPRPDNPEELVEGVQVSGRGLEGVHLGAAFDAVASAPEGQPLLAAESESALVAGPSGTPATGFHIAAAAAGETAGAPPAVGAARKRASDEHVAAPVQKRLAPFAGSEPAVLEMGAAPQLPFPSQQTQRGASATATEPTAVPATSFDGIRGFDANRWAANATAAASALSSATPQKAFAGLPAGGGCLSTAHHRASSAFGATAADSSVFGREDSLPVHRFDLDDGVSLGAIGLASNGDADGQELDDDLDEFSYVDFELDTLSPSGGQSMEATRGGIAAVHLLLPDLEARAAQMDAELAGEFAW